MARLFLQPGEAADVGKSQTTVFGQGDTSEFVTIQADSKTVFDGSFQGGGDTIRILGNAALYTISRSGGNVVLTAGNGANIVIPYSEDGLTITFNDATRNLAIDADTNVVTLGNQTVTSTASGVTPGSGVDPTPTDLIRLEVGNDILDGTSGNNLFRANVVQNQLGVQSNTLGTGDELNGLGGVDTLRAQLTEAVNLSGAAGSVQPITTGIENIVFEAQNNQQGSTYLQYGLTEIYVNAKDIEDHTTFASNYSDANLTIQDATTLSSNGSIRNLSELTVAMEYTGNDDSRWAESDFSVLFDQDYLNPETVAIRSARVALQAMNEDNYDESNGTEPLAGVYFSQLKFTLNGISYDLAPFIDENRPGSDGRELVTYNDLLQDIQDAIVELKAANPSNAAIQTLTATLGQTFTTDISPVTGQLREGTSIDLTVAPSTNGVTNVLTAQQTDLVLIPTPGLDPEELPNSNRYERALFVPPEFEDQLSINVDLEKVGRAGDGGELVIGSMNKFDVGESSYYGEDSVPILQDGSSYYEQFVGPNGVLSSLFGDYARGTIYKSYPNEWNDDFADSGISRFNVTVYGGSDKPSSLSGMHSTNNTLREVYVVTDAAQAGTFADLTIGNANTIGGNRGSFKDVATFNSTAFKGDMSLTAALTEQMDDKYIGSNDPNTTPIMVRYDFGVGNDSLDLEVGENESQQLNVLINMGGGDDSASVLIDGDAVDAITESFTLNLGEGNNSAYVFDTAFYDASISEAQDPQGVTQTVSSLLSNLTITAGAGNDRVQIGSGSNGQYFISTGAGSDTVVIDDGGDNTTQWFWSPNLWGGIPDGLDPLGVGIPVYKAQVQIRFAGFEGVANVNPGADLIATEVDFNNAILAAIASNPELQQLIKAEIGTIDQNLLFRTLIGGQNQIEVTLFQPELVVANPTGTQVVLGTADFNTLAAALIATGLASSSSPINAADGATPTIAVSDVVNYYNGALAAELGVAGPDSVAPGSVNGFVFYAHSQSGSETTHINNSVIDMGPGANDLVVLSSNDAAVNVLIFDEPWAGKTSIVNFFTNEDDLYAPTTPVAFGDGNSDNLPGTWDGLHGNHQLDFTRWLNAEITESGSSLSEEPKLIGVVDATANGGVFQANNIQVSNIDVLENASGGAPLTNLSYASLTALQVQAALNASLATPGATTDFTSATEQVGDAGELADGTTTRSSLLFVEDIDTTYQGVIDGNGFGPLNYENHGAYKVFLVTYGDANAALDGTATNTNDLDGASNGFTVSFLGELDFGNSFDFSGDNIGNAVVASGYGYDPVSALTLNLVNGAYTFAP